MAQGYGQQAPTASFSPSEAASKVELSISCSNLKDLDYFSRSDPCVFIFEQHGREWVKLGRTEVIDNNLNPKVRAWLCSATKGARCLMAKMALYRELIAACISSTEPGYIPHRYQNIPY